MGLAKLKMIYFVFVASVLGQQAALNGAVLELTGQTPRLIYGQLDASDSLTLTRNASEDKLICSGEFEAADLRIAGTSTTVADLIGEVATLRQEMAALKAFVGMMPPPAVPLPAVPPPSFPPPASPPEPCENNDGYIFMDTTTSYAWLGGTDGVSVGHAQASALCESSCSSMSGNGFISSSTWCVCCRRLLTCTTFYLDTAQPSRAPWLNTAPGQISVGHTQSSAHCISACSALNGTGHISSSNWC